MATRVHSGGPSPHTAGIFADMTVDGPEIGTLVIVFDRAKNLPNRKSLGKQNPYCAARLGKEAKKTETDQRGGQTPRWDQEIRFTVHDSPDYYNLKISVFSEDKRTDLIGEAWVDLTNIVKGGGGKGDMWQGLNCKGKYAGEVRLELTYYDTRPRPEKDASESMVPELRSSLGGGTAGRVKRRPLPSNPNSPSGHITPDTIPGPAMPGRAKHGPRDFRTPPRANSMPLESVSHTQTQPHPQPQENVRMSVHPSLYLSDSSPALPAHHAQYADQYHEEPTLYQDQENEQYTSSGYRQDQAHDFLPTLAPSNRQRAKPTYDQRAAPPSVSLPDYGPPVVQTSGLQSNYDPRTAPNQAPQFRQNDLADLPHSHSAPSLPLVEPENYGYAPHLQTDYPEPIPDLEYQHGQVMRNYHQPDETLMSWDNQYLDEVNDQRYHEEIDESNLAPPPPPVHSNSAPAVSHYEAIPAQTGSSPYGVSPAHFRHNSVPNTSPLQSIERAYGHVQRTPPSNHFHGSRPSDSNIPMEQGYPHATTPPHSHTPHGHTPPSLSRPGASTRAHIQHHNGTGDPFNTQTPPRPHPLSQEVPRPRSPNSEAVHEVPGPMNQPAYPPGQQYYSDRDGIPLVKPRALSPQPPPLHTPPSNTVSKHKSNYSIQFPVRAFASSEGNPLSTSSSPQLSSHSTPLRKSVSPRPSLSQTTPLSAAPFSPDSFDIHNPNVGASRAQVQSNSSSPHTPFQIRPGSEAYPQNGHSNGPITDWHGQEVDPSDHLPVDSWAPEPDKKTPTKTYGFGRHRDFGPRQPESGSGRHLSKDTVVNFRTRSNTTGTGSTIAPPSSNSFHAAHPPSDVPAPPTSMRNRLQKKFRSSAPTSPPITEPLREHHNYNNSPNPYERQGEYPQYSDNGFSTSPQKSPAMYDGEGGAYASSPAYSRGSVDALTREISSIDISGSGSGSGRRSLPAPVAYVPVRSHRDRKTYY